MLIHRFVPLFALGLNLLLLGSALVGDRRHRRNYLFAYVALALSVWNLGVFGLRATDVPEVAAVWEVVVHIGVIAIPILFYHYVLVFLELPARGRPLVAGYLFTAAFFVVSPTSLFLHGVRSTPWGYVPDAGPLYAPFFLYFYAYLVLGLVRLIRSYRSMRSSFRRNRITIVAFGVCVALVGGAVDFLRFILGVEHLYPIGIPSNAVFAASLGIAIVRYRLWDVSILAKRFVLYALISLGLVPTVAIGALYVIDRLMPGDRFAPNLPVVVVLLAVVAVLLPFLKAIERSFERFMFARQHGVRDALDALSNDMASILDLSALGNALTHGLVDRIPVVRAALYVAESPGTGPFTSFAHATSSTLETEPVSAALDERLILWLRLTGKPIAIEEIVYNAMQDPTMQGLAAELEAARVALIIPLLLEGQLAAVLVVCEKVSGEVFSAVEIARMQTLVAQTAIALKNARLYADVQRQMDELRTTQQQLIQAAKLAAIGQLAASVAHELNNPLTVIVARSDLLLRKADAQSPEAKAAEIINTEGLRASRIVRNLLDFARKREPKREPVSVNLLVPRALDLVQAKLRGRSVTVESALDPDVPVILGDGDELIQVLLNLIGNAIDAMPEGGRLGVTTEARRDLDAVVLSVSDTGTGMTQEQVSHIFEPFYTTKAEGTGTGLGLSVTLGIIKNRGGTISVDSEPANGTTMRVQLPVSSVEPRREATAAEPVPL